MSALFENEAEEDLAALVAANDRMCIVTRDTCDPDELIRFVAGPGGVVTPDLKRQLPGRGCWVKADRALVEKAIARKLFARALKTDAMAGADLADMVDRLLKGQLAGMMNMARKAGQFVVGSMKVDAAVRAGQAICVFHAADAAADGVRKIDQARKAYRFAAEEEEEIPSFRPFSAQEMEELMSGNAFIHACALAGQAGEGVVKRANLLETYRKGDQPPTRDGVARTTQ